MSHAHDQIDVVQRTVFRRPGKHPEARAVVLSRSYDAPIDDLWDACTNVERIARWLLPISGELRIGGRYQLEGNAGGIIEACDPPHRFAATWEYGGTTNWIEARLSAESQERTRLVLEHIVPDDEKWTRFGPGAVGVGWELSLRELAKHMSQRGIVSESEETPHDKSDDGRLFIILSSSRWEDAATAAGVDPDHAKAAAAATTAFYTGIQPEGNASPALRKPDLSKRPHRFTVERNMRASPTSIYRAWTERFDTWFASPGAIRMRPEVDEPFYFETEHESARHPHYGRFLALVPDRLVQLTWMTGRPGTGGAETVVTVELTEIPTGTHLRLTHTGFYDEDDVKQHDAAWPQLLARLDQPEVR